MEEGGAMFIWIAINVNSQLLPLRAKVKAIEKEIAFQDSDLTLPLHVSLKIPTAVPDECFENVVDDISSLFQKETPFVMETERLELHETIAWLKVKENPRLQELHSRIDQLLLDKYQIPRHDYDKDFIFHVTLFLDHEEAKVKEAFLRMLETPFPETLKAHSFVIGSSTTGAMGTYNVIKEIEVN